MLMLAFGKRTEFGFCSDVHASRGLVRSFEQLLDNIFRPLLEVTLDPRSHPGAQFALYSNAVPMCWCSASLQFHVFRCWPRLIRGFSTQILPFLFGFLLPILAHLFRHALSN